MSNSGHIHVNVAVNHAPVLTAPANVSANPGQVLSASSLFGAIDADNDALTYFVYDANSTRTAAISWSMVRYWRPALATH